MKKLLMASVEYAPCGSTKNVDVVPLDALKERKWDVSGENHFYKRGENYSLEAFDPNVIVCPACQGFGSALATRGVDELCELCGGRGDIDLAALDANDLTQDELRGVAQAVDENVREYGPHALTPVNYLYWLPLLGSSWPSPAELARAIALEREGKRDKAIRVAAKHAPSPVMLYPLRFLEAWEDGKCEP